MAITTSTQNSIRFMFWCKGWLLKWLMNQALRELGAVLGLGGAICKCR